MGHFQRVGPFTYHGYLYIGNNEQKKNLTIGKKERKVRTQYKYATPLFLEMFIALDKRVGHLI